jgi:HEPN domain-containing protein
MVDRKLIEEWIAKADEDFDFASSVITDSAFYGQICFHYQQAAEKYLKTFIVANELPFEKVHDLLALLKTCCRKEPSLSELKDDCTLLSGFYINTRYPVHWPTSYTRSDAFSAQKAAQNIGGAVKTLLKVRI